jgi:hypothetical protein
VSLPYLEETDETDHETFASFRRPEPDLVLLLARSCHSPSAAPPAPQQQTSVPLNVLDDPYGDGSGNVPAAEEARPNGEDATAIAQQAKGEEEEEEEMEDFDDEDDVSLCLVDRLDSRKKDQLVDFGRSLITLLFCWRRMTSRSSWIPRLGGRLTSGTH